VGRMPSSKRVDVKEGGIGRGKREGVLSSKVPLQGMTASSLLSKPGMPKEGNTPT